MIQRDFVKSFLLFLMVFNPKTQLSKLYITFHKTFVIFMESKTINWQLLILWLWKALICDSNLWDGKSGLNSEKYTAHWASTGGQIAYIFLISLVLSFSSILHFKSSLTLKKLCLVEPIQQELSLAPCTSPMCSGIRG